MPARLVIKWKSGERQIDCEDLVTIGRSERNELTLKGGTVSRSHALLRRLGDGKFYVMDMGSVNGTFLNDRRVLVPCELKDADRIRIGEYMLTFHFLEDAAPGTGGDAETDDSEATMADEGMLLRDVTTVVVDIRNYTAMSESIPVSLLARLLRDWFKTANELVERHGGVVDKFIGDAVMAVWMATGGQSTDVSVQAALKAAYEMHLAAEIVNRELPELPYPFEIGVGVNTGKVVMSNVGGSSTRDYTAVGDSVNLAFRFETATKQLKTDVVIGLNSFKFIPNAAEEGALQPVKVKGKGKPVMVHALTFDELARVVGAKQAPNQA